VGFVRTVLGDVDASELGLTYAHEHLVIAGGSAVELYPDILLDSVDKALEEVAPAQALRLGTVVDAMPADCGRDVGRLAAVSRRSGLKIVAATGLHTQRYYHDRHWSRRLDAERMAALFVGEIESGIDIMDLAGPTIDRSEHRAGVIKVGGWHDFPNDRDRAIFEAAAIAHIRTGAPILTHCEQGLRAPEQVRFLVDHGVDASRIAVSHVDKVSDREYHRDILAAGASVEYDQASRWGVRDNGTLRLIEWLTLDGHVDKIVMGHDHARRAQWTAYGGSPGMSYLLGDFSRRMSERGLSDAHAAIFKMNPASFFSFAWGPAPATTGPVGGT
jgi:phosphotriesterase-related protein